MLYIYFGDIDYTGAPDYMLQRADDVFDNYFKDEWMQDEWANRIVTEIAKSKILYPKLISSPVLGDIPMTWLSSGTKNLILMNHESGLVYNGNNMGDNCYPYLLELSKKRDIVILMSYTPIFEWLEGTTAVCVNDGYEMSTYIHFLNKSIQYAANFEVPWSSVPIPDWLSATHEYDRPTIDW